MLGIRHVALFVKELEIAVDFYTNIMGMRIEWQPDADNVYLTNDGDVFALHRVDYVPQAQQRLDHIGFVLKTPTDVDSWHAYFWKIHHHRWLNIHYPHRAATQCAYP